MGSSPVSRSGLNPGDRVSMFFDCTFHKKIFPSWAKAFAAMKKASDQAKDQEIR